MCGKMYRLLPSLIPVSLAVAIASCASSAATPAPAPAVEGPRPVIVVGAGVAGLAAARALEKGGFDVVIFEARDRIGGRAWTGELDGARVELGAMFIHGTEGNPVAELCDALGLDYGPRPIGLGPSYDAASRARIDAEATRFMWTLFGFENEVQALIESMPEETSMADAIERYLDDQELEGLERRLASFALRQLLVELYDGGPPTRSALRHYGQYEELEGGDQLLEQGYTALVEALASGLDVRLEEPVVRVEHDARGVTVTTPSGEHAGSHAIVTVPLGVLQQGSIVFRPPLSPEKTEAIERLDMGNLEKVILRFETAFWRPGEGTAHLAYVGDPPGEFPVFFDFSEHAGAPTLVALIGGQSARDMIDSKRDDEIVARALEVLGEILGREIPEPRAAVVTRWRDDPFSRGSYSYLPIGASPDDMRALGAPESERLLFAGEATVPEAYGTVHGALLSGLREARRIGGDALDLVRPD